MTIPTIGKHFYAPPHDYLHLLIYPSPPPFPIDYDTPRLFFSHYYSDIDLAALFILTLAPIVIPSTPRALEIIWHRSLVYPNDSTTITMIRRPGELVEEVTAYPGTEHPAPPAA